MEKSSFLSESPSLLDLCTLHQHAMRYYRLWIYACNTVLALATLVFTVFALSVLVDPRISLLSGVKLYQPTFLYAYVALLLQCGVLQAIGCLGALRLNQRLLNTYWTILFVLMIGDIIVGVVWVFRLSQIKANLRPSLKQRLSESYGSDPDFTQAWDWLQAHEMCCGLDGPIDFDKIMVSPTSDSILSYGGGDSDGSTIPPIPFKLPETCCTFTRRNVSALPDLIEIDPGPSRKPTEPPKKPALFPLQTAPHHLQQYPNNAINHPGPRVPPIPPLIGNPETNVINLQHTPRRNKFGKEKQFRPSQTETYSQRVIQVTTEASSSTYSVCELPSQYLHHPPGENGASLLISIHVTQHREGCERKMVAWIDHVTEVFFVIGFCIIVFSKACFLAILRYEIKEMIQKIRLLNGEDQGRTAAMNELIGLTALYNSEGGDEEAGNSNVDGDPNGAKTGDPPLPPQTKLSIVSAGGGVSVVGGNVYANHVGNNKAKTRVEIDDDDDSSSALLRRPSRKKKNEPKNGNNNSTPPPGPNVPPISSNSPTNI